MQKMRKTYIPQEDECMRCMRVRKKCKAEEAQSYPQKDKQKKNQLDNHFRQEKFEDLELTLAFSKLFKI